MSSMSANLHPAADGKIEGQVSGTTAWLSLHTSDEYSPSVAIFTPGAPAEGVAWLDRLIAEAEKLKAELATL